MVYLTTKELAVSAEDVIVATSSILKDMQLGSEVNCRPHAICALCRIVDVCTTFSSAHLYPPCLLSLVPAFDSTRRGALF
jgi:coatomer protein complex subunit gamma